MGGEKPFVGIKVTGCKIEGYHRCGGISGENLAQNSVVVAALSQFSVLTCERVP
jgi:hypothetical protein